MAKLNKTLLIGGSIEICGLINQMSRVYKNHGYRVVRLGSQSSSNDWYNTDFDIRQKFFFVDVLKIVSLSRLIPPRLLSSHKLNYFFRILFNNKSFVRLIFRIFIIPKIDVYIHVWDFDFYDREKFFQDLRKCKVEFRLICVGSDFMDWPLFFNYFHPYLPYSTAFEAIKYLVKPEMISFKCKMDIYEKYADVIFSAPTISMHSKKKAYYNYILPIDTNAIEFKINLENKLRIIHAPSVPSVKGTNVILNTIEKISKVYNNFEFEVLQNVKQVDLFKYLSSTDVLIDELYAPGPASLSHEAVSAGCIVLTFSDTVFRSQSEQLGGYYICVDATNLEEKLKELLSQHKNDPKGFKEYYSQFLLKARKYVEENNAIEKTVLRFIDLSPDGPFDFQPNPLLQLKNTD